MQESNKREIPHMTLTLIQATVVVVVPVVVVLEVVSYASDSSDSLLEQLKGNNSGFDECILQLLALMI